MIPINVTNSEDFTKLCYWTRCFCYSHFCIRERAKYCIRTVTRMYIAIMSDLSLWQNPRQICRICTLAFIMMHHCSLLWTRTLERGVPRTHEPGRNVSSFAIASIAGEVCLSALNTRRTRQSQIMQSDFSKSRIVVCTTRLCESQRSVETHGPLEDDEWPMILQRCETWDNETHCQVTREHTQLEPSTNPVLSRLLPDDDHIV